jgi:hypothetical protein
VRVVDRVLVTTRLRRRLPRGGGGGVGGCHILQAAAGRRSDSGGGAGGIRPRARRATGVSVMWMGGTQLSVRCHPKPPAFPSPARPHPFPSLPL